jgi:hypothetical protein
MRLTKRSRGPDVAAIAHTQCRPEAPRALHRACWATKGIPNAMWRSATICDMHSHPDCGAASLGTLHNLDRHAEVDEPRLCPSMTSTSRASRIGTTLPADRWLFRWRLMWLCGMPRIMRGMVSPAGTRRLPMDSDARARRDRGRLSESRAAGQQGQDSDDRKDSTDFHCNAPSPIPFYHESACEI